MTGPLAAQFQELLCSKQNHFLLLKEQKREVENNSLDGLDKVNHIEETCLFYMMTINILDLESFCIWEAFLL